MTLLSYFKNAIRADRRWIKTTLASATVVALGATGVASAEILFSDGGEGYTSAADAVSKGPWAYQEHNSWGEIGVSKNYAHSGDQSFRVCYTGNEGAAQIEIHLDKGYRRLFLQWWELRERGGDFSGANNYDWGGEKFNRFRSANLDGTTGIDYPIGWGAYGGGFGTSSLNDGGYLKLFGNSANSNGDEHFAVEYRMPRGEWHMFEVELNIGSQGTANGETRMWIDDVLKAQTTGLLLLPKQDNLLQHIWMGGWYSHETPNPKSCRYFDDVKVSTTRIGKGITPAPPSSVSVQ